MILEGDCLEELPALAEDSVDAIVTDPPYELAFMGRKWDASGIAYNTDMWAGCLRVLKPGGHLLAFGGTRTYHRMACAIEDAGFEIRDSIHWCYGSGFPKSLDISKALDRHFKAEREVIGKKVSPYTPTGRNESPDYGKFNQPTNDKGYLEYPVTAPATSAAKQWAGFGTALKPAHEIIVLARKPLEEKTIAENVLRWGCGALNIDGCRIGYTSDSDKASAIPGGRITTKVGAFAGRSQEGKDVELDRDQWKEKMNGRFPANLIHDGSPEVLAEFAKAGMTTRADKRTCKIQRTPRNDGTGTIYGKDTNLDPQPCYGDVGSAARFFQACPFTEEDIPAFLYYAKASRSERDKGLDDLPLTSCGMMEDDNYPIKTGSGNLRDTKRHNGHPCVKPLSLMRTLCRLITPPGGVVLDPFAGSGTTCMAAKAEGFRFIGIEKEPEYVEIAKRRIAAIPTPILHFSHTEKVNA